MPEESSEIDRRGLLQAGGVLASLSAFGGLVGEVAAADDGVAPQVGDDGVPEEARTVEAGLQAFAAKWEALGPYITNTKFGHYASNATVNCVVADDPRAFAVEFGPSGGVVVSPGRDPRAHATLALDEDDLLGVLYGEFCPFAPATQGNAYVPKRELTHASLFGLVLFLFAHLPASLAHDAGFNAENVFGALGRQAGEGVDCGGGPSGTAFEPEPPSREDALGTTDAPDVTEELATRVAVTTYDDLPESVVAAAKEQLKSIVGVCYAATELEPGRKFVEAVRSMEQGGGNGGGGEATAIAGDSFDASAERAGLVNAYLAQMLEWEDFTWYAHTGSATVPTALAAAEVANSSGKELLTAIALGNEIAGRVGEFASDPTSLGQALPVHQSECPFVAGKLMLGAGGRADDVVVRDLQAAAGFAAIQPERTAVGGWPSEAKGMIAGSPVRTSLEAAKFTDAGLVGRRDLMENPAGLFYGLTDVESPLDMQLAYQGLGEEWFMVDQFYNKRYATNGFFQAAVEAAVRVREQLLEAGIDPAEDTEFVDEIELHMNTAMAGTGTLYSAGDAAFLDEVANRDDFTYTALLYEAYYAIAATLLEGDLTHRQYREELRTDDRVRALFERTEAATDLSVGDFGGKVVVRIPDDEFGELRRTLNDREFSATVTCQRSAVDPGDSFGREKLRRAAEDTIGNRWERIDRAVDDIESFDDVNRFTRLL